MQSETKKQSFMGIWSGSAAVVCLVLAMASASYAYTLPELTGNWEGDSNDGWSTQNDAVATPSQTKGVTLGTGSLGCAILGSDTWNQFLKKEWGEWWQETPFTNPTQFVIDVTVIASEWQMNEGEWFNPLSNIVIAGNGADNWWYQVNPEDGSSYNWNPADGDKTFHCVFDLKALGNATYEGLTLVSNASSKDGITQWGLVYLDNAWIVPPTIVVSKCNVTAGKTQYTGDLDFNDMKDTFTASGTINGLPADLNTVSHIDVSIISADGNTIFFEANDFNYMSNTKKNVYTHKYKITKGNPTEGAITSMTINFTKKTFAITVTNADLTGLACPLQLVITIGDSVIPSDVTETIVNGSKKTIPTRLMRMYKDTLIVTKAKVKNSSKASADSLSVNGEIAVKDFNVSEPNLYASDVVITWSSADDTNSQTFTIPSGSFKIPKKGHLYKLNKNITPDVAPVADANTKVSGTIDLDKCTFALSISKADINAVSGDVKFGLEFTNADLNDFNETDNLNLTLGH